MVVVLTGKSCSGKDRVREKLCTENNWRRLIRYTSRPIRLNEVNNLDYHFVSKRQLNDMRDKNLILDYREYKVANGDIWGYGHWRYHKNFIGDNNYIYVAIADLDGAKKFKEEYGDNCLVIYIEAPYYQRRARANIRDDNALEIERRFKHDDIDFSNEKLYNIIDFSITNEDGHLGKTIDEITNYIEKYKENNKDDCDSKYMERMNTNADSNWYRWGRI